MYVFYVSVGGEIKVGQSFILSLLICLFKSRKNAKNGWMEGGIKRKRKERNKFLKKKEESRMKLLKSQKSTAQRVLKFSTKWLMNER